MYENLIVLDRQAGEPLQMQIRCQIAIGIVNRNSPLDEPLPSTLHLTAELTVSVMPVSLPYEELKIGQVRGGEAAFGILRGPGCAGRPRARAGVGSARRLRAGDQGQLRQVLLEDLNGCVESLRVCNFHSNETPMMIGAPPRFLSINSKAETRSFWSSKRAYCSEHPHDTLHRNFSPKLMHQIAGRGLLADEGGLNPNPYAGQTWNFPRQLPASALKTRDIDIPAARFESIRGDSTTPSRTMVPLGFRMQCLPSSDVVTSYLGAQSSSAALADPTTPIANAASKLRRATPNTTLVGFRLAVFTEILRFRAVHS